MVFRNRKRIKVSEITHVEGLGNYSKICFVGGRSLVVSRTLKFIEPLVGNEFLRIHRKYLVHNSFVLFTEKEVFINDNFVCQFSRNNCKKMVKKKYIKTVDLWHNKTDGLVEHTVLGKTVRFTDASELLTYLSNLYDTPRVNIMINQV